MNPIRALAALSIDTVSWLYPVLVVFLAAALESALVFGLYPEIKLGILLALSPLLYLLWLVLFLCINIVGTKLLFLFVSKPQFIEFNVLEDLMALLRLEPIIISYRLQTLALSLPFLNYFHMTPITLKWLRKLVMRTYSPCVHIGTNSVILVWPQDPDLTYIGDNVVIGNQCTLVAHGLNTAGGQFKYFTAPIRIENNSTLGGNCRIGMGVIIGEGAIVEVGSNVLPYTRIGKGEIWGGNPAVFIRVRNEYADGRQEVRNVEQKIDESQLNEIIAQAIRLPPEQIDDALNSSNCMAWDSLAQMSIAASLYDQFAIRIPAAQIFNLNSRQSIEQLIAEQQAQCHCAPTDVERTSAETVSIAKNPELLPLYEPDAVTQALARRFQEAPPASDRTVVIAATFTALPLGATLELWCRAFGLAVSIEFSEFDQVEQTLLASDSLFMQNPDGLHIVLLRAEDLIRDTDQDGRVRAGQLLAAIRSYVDKRKDLIVSNLPPVVSPFFRGDQRWVENLRVWWREQLEKIEGIQILDFTGVVEELGRQRCQDASLETLARAPYSPRLYQRLGIAMTQLVRGRYVPAKKVLALDCDGVLWGGIVGEDGMDGIALSQDHPGISFRLFQQTLLALKQRGVLLVLISKNNEEDVWNVFEQHPEMILRREDVAGHRINWQEKSRNLRALAEEFNLSLDAFVFVDDSPVERLEVETNAPEVVVIPMPEDPAYYAETLSKLWCFDAATVTDEDQVRTQLMSQEQQRKQLQHDADNLQAYLHSLGLVVEVRCAQERDLPRVAQLTQKTNQFNLSLIRRSLTEIRALHPSSTILVLHVKDRFGDYGLVGIAIVKYEDTSLLLDTYLISCRALGRGVEQSFLCTLFDIARQRSLSAIIAPYHLGRRNEQVKTFLLNMGFTLQPSDILKAQVDNAPQKPGYVQLLARV